MVALVMVASSLYSDYDDGHYVNNSFVLTKGASSRWSRYERQAKK